MKKIFKNSGITVIAAIMVIGFFACGDGAGGNANADGGVEPTTLRENVSYYSVLNDK